MATKDTTNISDSIHLSQADVGRVQIIVEQIAYHADLISNALNTGIKQLDHPQDVECLLVAKELVGKVGRLANIAVEKLDGATDKPAESWLLPPSFQWAGEKQEAQSCTQ